MNPVIHRRPLLAGVATALLCGCDRAQPVSSETPPQPAPAAPPAQKDTQEPTIDVKKWPGVAGQYQDQLERAAGQPVALSLVTALQEATIKALDATSLSGAALLVDIPTGRLLAMHSVAGRTKDPLGSAYPPAATFVPLVASAAAEALPAKVECRGWIERDGRRFRCIAAHGSINVERAIAESCNIYFFELAQRIGLGQILEHASELGFGAAALANIASDTGSLPDLPGKLATISLGQGPIRATPPQVARAYLRLLTGNYAAMLSLEKQPASVSPRATPNANLRSIRAGLRRAVTAGTASSAAAPPLEISGKTGTAQRAHPPARSASGDVRDDAWFVGYAPDGSGAALTVVLLESGGFGGKVAARVGSQLLQAWDAHRASP